MKRTAAVLLCIQIGVSGMLVGTIACACAGYGVSFIAPMGDGQVVFTGADESWQATRWYSAPAGTRFLWSIFKITPESKRQMAMQDQLGEGRLAWYHPRFNHDYFGEISDCGIRHTLVVAVLGAMLGLTIWARRRLKRGL